METNEQVMARWLARSLSGLEREAGKLRFAEASRLIGAAELAVQDELLRGDGAEAPGD